VAWALAGGLLTIVGALLMSGRRVRTVVETPVSGREPVAAAPRPEPEADRDVEETSERPTSTFTEEEARMLGLHEDFPPDSPTAIPTTKPPTR